MLVGSENGAVRIFPLVEGDSSEHHIEDFSSYWTFNVHDNHYGHVTHICCSHDDKYVLTAGNDGNIFVFKACLEAKPKKKELLHQGDIKVRTVFRAITVSVHVSLYLYSYHIIYARVCIHIMYVWV